jgi:hypothetical protein
LLIFLYDLAAVITLANHMMTKEKYALAEALYKRALEKYTLSLGKIMIISTQKITPFNSSYFCLTNEKKKTL